MRISACRSFMIIGVAAIVVVVVSVFIDHFSYLFIHLEYIQSSNSIFFNSLPIHRNPVEVIYVHTTLLSLGDF